MTYNDRGGYDYEFVQLLVAERDAARADHATAYANTVALAQECARLRAELTDVRAVLAAVDELGRGMSIGLSRATRECDALRAELVNSNDAADKWRDLFVSNEKAITRVRELCDKSERERARTFAPWLFESDILAALEGNQP